MAIEKKTFDLRLYLVTDRELCAQYGLAQTVAAAVCGGVSMVQLRDKKASTLELAALARGLKETLTDTGIALVINDDVDAALAADVDGVHLGQCDGGPQKARALLGPEKIIGLSCGNAQEVQSADASIIDYLGIGAVFDTKTKELKSPTIGLDGLTQLCALSPLPTVAIGGLKAHHAQAVFDAGADGIAVVSAICGQHDPKAAAQEFFQR